jgi:hypothetical protein
MVKTGCQLAIWLSVIGSVIESEKDSSWLEWVYL